MGRLPYPLVRRKGERSFQRASWDEALDRIAAKIRAIDPEADGVLLNGERHYERILLCGSQGRAIYRDEQYRQRFAHLPFALEDGTQAIGRHRRIQLQLQGLDRHRRARLLGQRGGEQSAGLDEIHVCGQTQAGRKIIVINPYREPAMERYWIPSIAESALFGTKLADDFYQVNIGGDIAFMNGRHEGMVRDGRRREPGSAVDHAFVREHANGYEALRAHVRAQDWEQLEQSSGLSRERMSEFAELLAARRSSGVFVWSMGLTQHRFGTDNISQVANLALLRGFLGREHCGLMPIRGHSGVQGSGEMGADPFSLPGGEFTESRYRAHREGLGLPAAAMAGRHRRRHPWRTRCCRRTMSGS